MVGESGDADGEVGGQVVGAAPEVAQVCAGGVDDGEAWDPGCVEASGTDDGVDGVLGAVAIEEAGGCEALHWICVDCCVVGDECLEVSRRRRWTTTTWIEVGRDDGVA